MKPSDKPIICPWPGCEQFAVAQARNLRAHLRDGHGVEAKSEEEDRLVDEAQVARPGFVAAHGDLEGLSVAYLLGVIRELREQNAELRLQSASAHGVAGTNCRAPEVRHQGTRHRAPKVRHQGTRHPRSGTKAPGTGHPRSGTKAPKAGTEKAKTWDEFLGGLPGWRGMWADPENLVRAFDMLDNHQMTPRAETFTLNSLREVCNGGTRPTNFAGLWRHFERQVGEVPEGSNKAVETRNLMVEWLEEEADEARERLKQEGGGQ
jgi:hypothetical protein